MHDTLLDYAELEEKMKRGSSKSSGNSSGIPQSHNGSSEDDLGGIKLRLVKEKLREMEPESGQMSMQEKNQYTQIIEDLSNELQSLTEQLIQQTQQQKEISEDSLDLKNLLEDLEQQNDHLQRTIETYAEQLTSAETKIQKLEFEKSTLESDLKAAHSQLEGKDAKFEELQKENRNLQSKLNIIQRLCTCKASSMVVDNDNGSDNTDKSTQSFQELQKLLNQKASEASKAKVSLKWKSLECSRVQQLANEDKKKLTEQTRELITNVGELKQKIITLEMNAEKREKELEKATQKLENATRKEAELLAEIAVKTDQLLIFEKGEAKYREAIDDLSHELQAVRTSRARRESVMIQELNAANTSLRGGSQELEKINSNLIKENAMLKNEMSNLRQHLATLEGKSRALSDLLRNNQIEMDRLKQEINRLMALDAEAAGIREDKAIFEKHNQDLLKRYQALQKDYEELQIEYKLLLDIKSQTEIILENMKMWEDEHDEREKIIQKKISKQSEHINTLLEDRKMLITKINTMHQDIVILTSERERYEERFKEMINGPALYLPNAQDNTSLPTKLVRYSSEPQLNDQQNVLRKVKQSTRRMSKTRKLWEEHMKDAFH
ncbi:putative leucine-rich repeat-containing protein DDB_G0290503 isoform X2 [Lutzomyia longipalpis]|uniref:putative leucine-rich repeat-containing protein DDB_G0290503 isoform X2 n=1 Tax=Lutzomyia longipalpis TaxID=7200 RepID=UPI00248401FA|nr:putative leucine-rich repeat-containing protein DDB_G0290503 isoform X2 [Lutzomyia longipalpis]